MLDWTTCPAVERHSDRVSGAWVFQGTRVPVAALFDNLEGGATADEFLEWFPGVSATKSTWCWNTPPAAWVHLFPPDARRMRILLDYNFLWRALGNRNGRR